MKLKRFFCALLIMTICVLFASCDYSDNDKHLDFADEYREYGNMLVLGVVNDTDLTEDGVVYLDSITDNLNIQFANLTEYDSEYILKLFLILMLQTMLQHNFHHRIYLQRLGKL